MKTMFIRKCEYRNILYRRSNSAFVAKCSFVAAKQYEELQLFRLLRDKRTSLTKQNLDRDSNDLKAWSLSRNFFFALDAI